MVGLMEMFFIEDEQEWKERRYEIWGVDIDEKKEPKRFPCVAIRAYRGCGWEEVDFVYKGLTYESK
jgi:hypothetical protein